MFWSKAAILIHLVASTAGSAECNIDSYRLEQLGERLLDANRTLGQPDKLTVIFGRKINPRYPGQLKTVIEDPQPRRA
jgi:hypothetical protein